MRTERWAGLRVSVAGGSDREGGGDGPVVVLMHGFGASGDDLVPLWRVMRAPRGTRFVFPEAPLALQEYGPTARAWWQLDMPPMLRALQDRDGDTRSKTEPKGLAAARDSVNALLDEVRGRLAVPDERVVLGGFSQGAMLSCDVALRSQRAFAGLLMLSGTLIAEHVWSGLVPGRRALPVFQSHGRQDPILPFAGAERLHALWQGAGAEVEFVPFNGVHEIPFPVLERVGAFLGRVLA